MQAVAVSRDRGLIAAQIPAAVALSHLLKRESWQDRDGADIDSAKTACR